MFTYCFTLSASARKVQSIELREEYIQTAPPVAHPRVLNAFPETCDSGTGYTSKQLNRSVISLYKKGLVSDKHAKYEQFCT